MSASTFSASYPAALREHAFERYCAGQRSPAIAKELHVPERTIRSWLATTCQQLSDARSGTAQAAAALAEARQLQIAAAAWDSYRRHAEAEQHQLDDLRYATHDEMADPRLTPRLSAAGARYLALALRATDLAAKLSGAYTCPPPQPAAVELRMLHARSRPQDYEPPGGPHVPVLTGLELERWQHQEWVDSLQAQIESDQELLAQGRTRLAELNTLLAPTSPDPAAPPPPPADPPFADEDDEDQDDEDPAQVNSDPNPNTDPDSSAESATTEDGLAAGLQPANPDPTVPMPVLTPHVASDFPAETAIPAGSPRPVGAARAAGSDDVGAERAERAAVGLGVGFPSVG